MKARLLAIFTTLAAAIGLSVGLFALPAAAANSATTTTVFDATSNAAWAGTEVYPASAYDTAVVTPDISPPAGGSLTYSFFTSSNCTGTATSAGTVTLNSTGTVPQSNTEGPLNAGNYSFDATYTSTDGINDSSLASACEPFTVGHATPSTPTISNLPASGAVGKSFLAAVSTTGDGVTFVTSNSLGVCSVGPDGLTVTYVGVGTCSLTASVMEGTNYGSLADTSPQTFSVGQGTATAPTITNIPGTGAATFGGPGLTASVSTNGDGTKSVTSSTTSVCTVGNDGVSVTYAGAGVCALTAHVGTGANYLAADGTAQIFTVAQAAPNTPTITNLPTSGTFGSGFTATLNNNDSNGTQSVTSNTPTVCSTNGLAVSYVGVGTCSLNAQVAAGSNYLGASGSAQTFTIGRAGATTPTITNIPSPASEFFGFTAIVGTTGDGTTSVVSSTPKVCSVGTNGLTVTFVGFGTCSLTPSVAQGPNHFGATGSLQTFPVQEASHGYWLVGSDGGIFSFGSAAFHGSMGGTPLQRPVVAITPTSTGNGYWLVASDGGIFSFGDATYYGSLPGIGFHPAGSGLPQSLNAPIVGMVPTFTGHGYFMVASDGGVFAFGDGKFEGSCPGIGGCTGTAVAVMPDQTGNGYWLVTNSGAVYAFGDATYYGAPAASTVPVVDAVATRDGHGYWLVYANGVVSNFGDATNFGSPLGYVNGFNPATTIFPTADAQGYWVASARGDVFSYGDSPYLGSMAAAGLNGEIIGAFGF
jgi:hypothetical protein